MRLFRLLSVALVCLLGTARVALACDYGLPTLEQSFNQAEVVAIGTLVGSSEERITLQVEQYLKGAADTPELTLNNHSLNVGPDCSEAPGAGGYLPEGQRVVAFLVPDAAEESLWRPAGLGGLGIYSVEGDQLQNLTMSRADPQPLSLLTELAERAAGASLPEGLLNSTVPQALPPEAHLGNDTPLVVPPVEHGPGVVGERFVPLPQPLPPQEQPAPVARPTQPGLLPRLLLGTLLAIGALLALWACLQLARRRSLR